MTSIHRHVNRIREVEGSPSALEAEPHKDRQSEGSD